MKAVTYRTPLTHGCSFGLVVANKVFIKWETLHPTPGLFSPTRTSPLHPGRGSQPRVYWVSSSVTAPEPESLWFWLLLRV